MNFFVVNFSFGFVLTLTVEENVKKEFYLKNQLRTN